MYSASAPEQEDFAQIPVGRPAMSGRGPTRRGLLGGAVATGAGAAVPAAAAANGDGGRRHKRSADVAVVGAGLSGLTTARALRKKGHSVVVLEARDRVGGRTWTKQVKGVPVDVGGQWIGPQQTRIAALASAVGVKTFPTYNTGLNVYDRLGTLKTYTGAIPPAETPAIADIAVALGALNEMAGEVPLAAPWKAPRAREWDGQTLETWKLANMTTEEGRVLLDLGVEAVFAGEPRDVSLLHVLFYIHSAGSFDNLINTAGGAQESRFVGGSQLVSRRVAKALGSRVVLSSPVRRIDQRRRQVVVESDRVEVEARYCVVTAPPALAGRIEYHPALPGRRDQLTQRMPMGSVLKCHAIYAKPFWRDDGRLLLDLGIEAVFSGEPRDVSLLHVLFYIHSSGSFENLISTAEEDRFVGGAQLVSRRVAKALGSRVVLSSPVRRIVQRRRHVVVESDRVEVEARYCVVTAPPALAGRIEYHPALPGRRDQLTQRMPMGSVLKCHAIYAKPFWRDDGRTGQATSDTGPVKVTFDNSPPSGKPGILLGFIGAEQAREWSRRSLAKRRAAVLAQFARWFGSEARSPQSYIEQNWMEEAWSRGCYGAWAPPGVLLDYGAALTAPVGRIHWAGTETATEWCGYMDGAVRSGERVAAELHKLL